MSFVSSLASNACYCTSDAYVPGGNACGDMFEEMRSVETMPSVGNVNTCAVAYGVSLSVPTYQTAPMVVANGTIRTVASEIDNGTLAAMQPLYAGQYETPSAQPVRRSPGVPSRAPIGDALCPLLVCAAVSALFIRGRRYLS